jgi:hypothetical protein
MRTMFSYAGLMVVSGAVFFFSTVSAGQASPEMGVVRDVLSWYNDTVTKPEDITKLENGRVVYLDLSNRDFGSDGITDLPPVVAALTELKTLIVKGNSLNSLPESIHMLQKLQRIDLSHNNFSVFPKELFSLPNLEVLDLQFNHLAALPNGISAMRSLKSLQLWGNRLTTLPAAIAGCSALKELYLSYNRLSTLPDAMASMKSLTYVDFQFNRFCNVTPKIDEWLKTKDSQYRTEQYCGMRDISLLSE